MQFGLTFRLYPNKEQRQYIDRTIGAARWVYNWALERSIEKYRIENKNFNRYELNKEMALLKRVEETAWLKDIDSRALQASVGCLELAFNGFFSKKKGFPSFKRKGAKDSFITNTAKIRNGKLRLPKLKSLIKCKGINDADGRICYAVIAKSPSGKYFCSLQIDGGKELPDKQEITEQGAIGLDLGLTNFATLSTGEKIANPRNAKKLHKLLARRQRQCARSKAGSMRKEKRRVAVAKVHERVSNQRKDFLHKLSTRLIRENQAVAIEDLAVGNMVKNRCLSRAISEAGWSTFVGMLKYKADWYGKTVLQIGRFEPTSKLCTCGVINTRLTLADRTWTCGSCGATHDRDILAANNIKWVALRQLSVEQSTN